MKQPWRSHYNAICGDWVAKHKRTTRNGVGNCSSKTGSRRQSEKKTILKHFLKGFLEGKSLAPKWRKSADKSLSQPSCSHSNTIYEVQLQKTIVLRMQPQHEATFTQPLQCDLRRTELQNTRELRAMASEIVAPKPDSTPERKKDDFEALFKRIFRRKITNAKMEKICWQITVAAFMQPLQYDLRSPAAKDNSITHAATAWSNLHAAITMRSAETELQNTIELRATASEIVAPKPDLDARAKKNDFEALFKRIFRRKITSAKMEKKMHFVRDFLQNSIGNSSTSTTCNPIYIAGTILQLQITMEFCRPHMHEKHLKPHLQYGTDPRMIRPWSDHTRDRIAPVAPQR